MASTNLDAHNLFTANLDGVIHEDVLNNIFDISNYPLPLTERIGTGSHSNQYFSWRMDKLRKGRTDNKRVDGQETATGTSNETKVGRRVGNHSEILSIRLEVSTRAQRVNTIGYANELSYQISRRNIEIRRDVEASMLSNNGSVRGTDTVAGQTAGLAAWITTVDVDGNAGATNNAQRGATGANGGWDDTAANSLVAASTPGTTRALTERMLKNATKSIYENGGSHDLVCMTTPNVKEKISEYMFTSSARIATMYNNAPSGAAEERKAQGSVDLFITDYGTLQLVPNREQPAYTTDNDIVYVLDPGYLQASFLNGYRVEPLAKQGFSDNRHIMVDWGLKVLNWDSQAAIYDINPALDMTAG